MTAHVSLVSNLWVGMCVWTKRLHKTIVRHRKQDKYELIDALSSAELRPESKVARNSAKYIRHVSKHTYILTHIRNVRASFLCSHVVAHRNCRIFIHVTTKYWPTFGRSIVREYCMRTNITTNTRSTLPTWRLHHHSVNSYQQRCLCVHSTLA